MALIDHVNPQRATLDSRFGKYLITLQKPTKRAKDAIKNTLQKSQERFSKQLSKSESGKPNVVLKKKLEKISNQLDILKQLTEDDIIRFSLTTQQNIMAVAANRRTPKVQQMMARIASRKPLSTHLARIKSKLEESGESGSEEEQTVVEGNTSATLDKITLNNQIIKMKKDVKRAKIHIIHKLTRKVAMLGRSKGGNEIKMAKNGRKAARMVKKISCIVKLDDNDISVFALTNTQDLNKLSNDMKASLKTQTMATIAMHKFVAMPVADFKNKFPDWQKTVPALLKKKKNKRKLDLETKEIGKISNKIPTKKLKGNDTHKNYESSNEISEEINEDEEIDESGGEFGEKSDLEDESDDNDDNKSEAEERETDQETSNDTSSDVESESDERPSKKPRLTTNKGSKKQIQIPPSVNKKTPVNQSADKKQNTKIKVKKEKFTQNNNVSKPTNNMFKVTGSPLMAKNINNTDEEGVTSDEKGVSSDEKGVSSDEEGVSSGGSQSIFESVADKKPQRKVVSLNNLKTSNDVTSPSKKIKATINEKLINNRKNSNKIEDHLTSSSKLVSKPDLNENRPKVVDPFFVTASNEEYVTSQAPVEIIEDSYPRWKTNNEDFNSTNANRFNKFHIAGKQGKLDDRRTNKFRNYETKSDQKPFVNSFEKVNNSRLPSGIMHLGNRKDRRKALQRSFQEEKVEKLHPSWEAKKKNSSLATFQGKKITFD